MRITFKAFDSKMASREKLFKAGLEFANKLKREDIISITHTEDRDNIVLTVWYWTDEVDKGQEIKKARTSDLAHMGSGAALMTDGGGDGLKPNEQRIRPNRETHHDLPRVAPAPDLGK
ncbi:MAG: hypothetical protein JNM56_38450 [Planctomycetia bacterium]|nr:hypothetical protein [Planctomycetia bacterium]